MIPHLSPPPDHALDDAALATVKTSCARMQRRIDLLSAAVFVLLFALVLAGLEIAHCHGWIDWSL